MKIEETIKNITELVHETHTYSSKDMTKIAYSLSVTGCGIYVLKMKELYNIIISI